MKSNDLIKTREEARAAMMQALRDNNSEAFGEAFDQMLENIQSAVSQEAEKMINDFTAAQDEKTLETRGVRQLTSEEKSFYQKFGDCIKSKNPTQALTDMNLAFPETVINSVFEDLRTEHPLLSKIDFMPTGAAVKMIMNTNGVDRAQWGELCDEIVKEAAGGIKVVETTLFKLSAFIFVCKQLLILGPSWLDRFVRETLYEYFANGLEYGIVTGTGKDMPIGMDRQVGEGVVRVDDVYPKKEIIEINNLGIITLGNLISMVSVNENGRPRNISNMIMVVNPADYYSKVFPATHFLAPDGTWRNALPYPVSFIPSAAVTIGEAVFGLARRYFAAAGSSKEGNIEYSDHYRFLEDQRTYIIKGFANGMPKDNKAFLRLDIRGLEAPAFRVENVTYTKSNDATLNGLKVGALRMSPEFVPSTSTYTAATTNAKNVVNAVAANAGATVTVSVNGEVIQNGSAYEWKSGENVVTVNVTAEDGTTKEEYTVTVTKS